MDQDIKSIAQQIMQASYNVYSDVSSINKAMQRAGSLYGLEFESGPEIDLGAAQEVPAQEAVLPETSKAKEHHRGFFSKRTKNQATAIHAERKETPIPPLRFGARQGQPAPHFEHEEPSLTQTLHLPVMPAQKAPSITIAAGKVPQAPQAQTPLRGIGPAATPKTEIATPLPTTPPMTQNLQNIAPKPQIEPQVQKPVQAPSLSSAPKVGAFVLKGENLNKYEQAAIPSEKEIKLRNLNEIRPPLNITKLTPEKEAEPQAEAAPINVSTNPVSSLLSLVKSRKSITISEAASELKVPREYIEKWAKILQQNMLIRMKYELVGDAKLEA